MWKLFVLETFLSGEYFTRELVVFLSGEFFIRELIVFLSGEYFVCRGVRDCTTKVEVALEIKVRLPLVGGTGGVALFLGAVLVFDSVI